MSRVFVSGWGAVSPAGWGVAPLRQALQAGKPLPVQPLARPGWDQPLRARMVPVPVPRPAFFAHPRLRRASPITQYAAAAALEALGDAALAGPTQRRGLILCLQAGCVQYSYRFFEEALNDPATASPLLFPETVFAAPASHLAALVPNMFLVHTLVGDPSVFLQGLVLATDWLAENRVETCLVVGAEEINWLLADGVWHFNHQAILTGGAGALCVRAQPELPFPVELEGVTDAHAYLPPKSRAEAAQQMRRELPPGAAGELLCDGLQDHARLDAPEKAAWQDWPGRRLSLKTILGEGLMAAAAWQCVAACEALVATPARASHVSLVGANHQAIGARFVRHDK
jgi:hypothetical protein